MLLYCMEQKIYYLGEYTKKKSSPTSCTTTKKPNVLTATLRNRKAFAEAVLHSSLSPVKIVSAMLPKNPKAPPAANVTLPKIFARSLSLHKHFKMPASSIKKK